MRKECEVLLQRNVEEICLELCINKEEIRMCQDGVHVFAVQSV